jgi:hypothetical protein
MADGEKAKLAAINTKTCNSFMLNSLTVSPAFLRIVLRPDGA